MPSLGEPTEKVICSPPTRTWSDDQIVELFLEAYPDSRFAHLEWLPQDRSNVEVIATDAAGTRLAVEHTRVFAYQGHKKDEELLRPIAKRLEHEAGLRVRRRTALAAARRETGRSPLCRPGGGGCRVCPRGVSACRRT